MNKNSFQKPTNHFNISNTKKNTQGFQINTDSSKKKLLRYLTVSKISTEDMNLLIKKMYNTYFTMIKDSGIDTNKLLSISNSGIDTSNKLLESINYSKVLLNKFNLLEDEDFINFTYQHLKKKKKTSENKNKKNFLNNSQILNKNNKEKTISNEFNFNLNYHCFKSKKEFRKNKKYLKKCNQLEKLTKLKGDIEIKEQRKKYALKKTFEPIKIYKNSDFMRNDNDLNKLKYKKIKSKYLQCFNIQNIDDFNEEYFKTFNANEENIFSPLQSPKKHHYNNSLGNNSDIKSINTNFTLNVKTFGNNNNNNNDSNLFNFITNDEPKEIKKKNYKKIFLSQEFRPKSCITRINNKKIKEIKKEKMFKKINNIQRITINEKEKLEKETKKNSNHFKSYSISEYKKKKSNIDINKINKDFGFSDSTFKVKNLDEIEIVKKNAKNVEKHLDEKSKKILKLLVENVLFDNYRLNKGYVEDSLYEKKIFKIKNDKEIKKLSEQTTNLEKEVFNGELMDRKKEEKYIIRMSNEMIDDNFNSYKNLENLLRRCHVLKAVFPLLRNNPNERKIEKK